MNRAAILTVAMSLFLTGCIKDDVGKGDIVEVGDSLPQFSVTMNDGTVVSTGDLAGSVSLIMFFDTTCGDCQKALPIVDRLYLELEGLVRFVCISRAQGEDTVAPFWEENGFSVPYSAQNDRKVYNLFATNIVPRIYISDPDLIVQATFDDDPVPTYAELLSAILDIGF